MQPTVTFYIGLEDFFRDLFFREKTLVATNIILSRQKYKLTFVATNTRQAYFCLDKRRVCRDKNDTCGSSRQ